MYIHNAPVADFAVVLARTDPHGGRAGMSVFLVDLDRPGVRRPYREKKMGQRASPVGGLRFESVRAALTAAAARAETRVAFGRPIGANQAVAFPTACSMAKLYASEACKGTSEIQRLIISRSILDTRR